MVAAGPDQQLLRELKALREAVEALQAVQDARSKVTLRPVSAHLFLGRPVAIVATVSSASGAAARINAPVTFTTNWGRLRVTTGGRQEGSTVTTRTDSHGVARAILLAPTPEGLQEAQQNALLAMLELLDGNAPTPRETEAGLREMARQYRLRSNASFRQAVDVYFRGFQSQLVDTINQYDYMQGWSFYDATVTAYAGDTETDDGSETTIQGIGLLTLRFKDWLGPWLETFLALNQEESGLDEQLRGVKARGSDTDTLVGGVFGQLRSFFANQHGLVGEYAGRKIAESSVRRFLGTDIADLPLETQLNVFPTLEAVTRNVGTAGVRTIESLDQTRTDLRKTMDTRLAGTVNQDTLTSTINNAFASRDLVTTAGMNSAISQAFASRDLISSGQMVTAIDNAFNSRDVVTTTGMNSAIDSAFNSRDLVTTDSMNTAINRAITNRNLVSSGQMVTAIDNAFNSRDVVTTTGMNSAIDSAFNSRDLVTTDSMNTAINRAFANRDLISSGQMVTAIDNAFNSRDIVTTDRMTSAIDSAFNSRDLVTTDSMNTAINRAFANRDLISSGQMVTAIDNAFNSRDIVTTDRMTSAIDNAFASRNLVDRTTFENRVRELDNSVTRVGNNLLNTRTNLFTNFGTPF